MGATSINYLNHPILIAVLENDSILKEIFYGRELRPVFFNNIDVKGFVTNRIGLTLWALNIISVLHSAVKFHTVSPG